MDETLQKIKDLVYAEVENNTANPDAWMQPTLLPIYLQFKTLDMLEGISNRLENIETQLVSMNPLYK